MYLIFLHVVVFIYYIFINLTLVNNNIRNTHLQNIIKNIFSVSNLDNRAI